MEHLLTPDANPPVHVQNEEEEAFYVLEGEIEFEVDGTTATARPGTFALVPRGAAHSFYVLTDTARVLIIASAPDGAPGGGLHHFFETAGTPAPAPVLATPSAPDPVVMTALAAAHGIDILPPPGTMKLLVTVAHPDDEAFGCGSVLAHATAAGIESVVVCATRGELGEVTAAMAGDVTTAAGVIDQARLGARREAELRSAAQLLGVGRVEVLGWRDSGVDGEPAPGALVAAPTADVVAAIVRVVDDERPDVVVTLDASDGHRDHAVIRDATLAAVARTSWRPARTYLWCLPRSMLGEFSGDPTMGTPDDDVTTVVDISGYLDLRWQAMRAHVSQMPPYDLMTPELRRRFLTTDHLLRVEPPWTGGPVETDWRPTATLTAGQNQTPARRSE